MGVIPPGARSWSTTTALELIKDYLLTSVDFESFADDGVHMLSFSVFQTIKLYKIFFVNVYRISRK